MASSRSTAATAKIKAQQARKDADGAKAQEAAVAEAARVRRMFADDRSRLEKRYGVVSARTMSSESDDR